MDQNDSLTRLQGLQADLVAFSESRLLNVDRLWTELEDSIADFRKLLDRQNKSDKSRQALKAGTLFQDSEEEEDCALTQLTRHNNRRRCSIQNQRRLETGGHSSRG